MTLDIQDPDFYKLLFKNLKTVGVILFDTDCRYTFAEGEPLTISGYNPESMIGKTIYEVLGDVGARNLMPKYKRILNGETIVFDYHFKNQNRYYTINMFPIIENKEIVGGTIFIQEITKEKLGQIDLETILESTLIGVMTLDSVRDENNKIIDFQWIMINDAASKIVHRTDLVGKLLKAIYPENNLFDEYVKVVETGKPMVVQNFHAGTDVHVWIELSAVKKQDGIVLTFRSIDDHKKRERELQQALESLKVVNDELEQFAYIASHDLQEPLRMVSSYVSLLKNRYYNKFDDTAKEFIDFAVEGSERMADLIKDLLAYSRAGKELDFKDVDLNDVIKYSIKNLMVSIEENNVTLEVGDLPVIHGSLNSLIQLFQNLLSNAIKFRDKDRDLIIKIKCKETEQSYHIIVCDNGIGIDKKHYEKIFLIFQRLYVRGEYSGTGLGLALVKRICERHNGDISVKSVVDKGSTFKIKLPKPN